MKFKTKFYNFHLRKCIWNCHLRNRVDFGCRSVWRHSERDGVSTHQRLHLLLNRLFRRKSTKTSKLRITCLCEGNPPVTGGFPHKGPVTRKMFPFEDVIMWSIQCRFRAYVILQLCHCRSSISHWVTKVPVKHSVFPLPLVMYWCNFFRRNSDVGLALWCKGRDYWVCQLTEPWQMWK